jgi:arabinose-5-phosphate isomerase
LKNAKEKRLRRAREVFEIEIGALKAVRDQLDETFTEVVELIAGSVPEHGKLVIAGIGKSGNIGQKIAATFNSTGTTAVLLHTIDALHGDLGMINDGDVILALSYSGETEELLNLLPALKRFNVKIVSFTCSGQSTLGRYSDYILKVKVPKEACPFNMAPTASTTAMLALGDALAMGVLEERGFTEKDYARHHPAGAIGRALLLRVSDIMRSGTRNAVAPAEMKVKEALLVMTRARSGSLSVVDKRGKLAGVFTDGDFRRQMANDDDVLDQPLARVMTRNPISIRDDALAAEALKVFDARNIDDIIVVNKKREPVGLVDSQDLPKLKIM